MFTSFVSPVNSRGFARFKPRPPLEQWKNAYFSTFALFRGLAIRESSKRNNSFEKYVYSLKGRKMRYYYDKERKNNDGTDDGNDEQHEQDDGRRP